MSKKQKKDIPVIFTQIVSHMNGDFIALDNKGMPWKCKEVISNGVPVYAYTPLPAWERQRPLEPYPQM